MRPSSVTTSYRLIVLVKKSGLRAFTITCTMQWADRAGVLPGVQSETHPATAVCHHPLPLAHTQHEPTSHIPPTHHVKKIPPGLPLWQEAVVGEAHHAVGIVVIRIGDEQQLLAGLALVQQRLQRRQRQRRRQWQELAINTKLMWRRAGAAAVRAAGVAAARD